MCKFFTDLVKIDLISGKPSSTDDSTKIRRPGDVCFRLSLDADENILHL